MRHREAGGWRSRRDAESLAGVDSAAPGPSWVQASPKWRSLAPRPRLSRWASWCWNPSSTDTASGHFRPAARSLGWGAGSGGAAGQQVLPDPGLCWCWTLFSASATSPRGPAAGLRTVPRSDTWKEPPCQRRGIPAPPGGPTPPCSSLLPVPRVASGLLCWAWGGGDPPRRMGPGAQEMLRKPSQYWPKGPVAARGDAGGGGVARRDRGSCQVIAQPPARSHG